MSFDRRRFLSTSSAALAIPFVHTAYAAQRVSIASWDHFVPGATDTVAKLCREWASREQVELHIDFITSQGNKHLLTIAAEQQAHSGHDVLFFPVWSAAAAADDLVVVDDVMAQLIEQNGAVSRVAEYLGRQNGHWVGVPSPVGSQISSPCARIDLFKKYVGIDLTEMYPPGAPAKKSLAAQWTWDLFLTAAEKCFKAGYPFGMPLGQTADSVNWVGAVFASYGAQLVDEHGNVTTNSDAVKQVLEWFRRLVLYLPPGVISWDDQSNNKWLISGKGALIMNPPSAWAVAVRDAPQVAGQLWTFPSPAGPKGRFAPANPNNWGIWKFSKNISAAKSLLMYLSRRSSVEQIVAASHGYDIPAFEKLHDFKIWDEEGPPRGTLSHYPPRDDQIVSIACAPAPPKIAQQMYTQAVMPKMIARMAQGDSTDTVIEWVTNELEGLMRV